MRTDREDWAPGERTRAALFSALLCAAVLYPLRQHLRPRSLQEDGFPLSHYPMFSKRRCRSGKMYYAVAVDAEGGRRYVPSRLIGTGGFNQARHQLSRAARGPRGESFARELAARLAAHPEYRGLVRVELVRGEFDLDNCMLSGRVHGDETVLASAEAPVADKPVLVYLDRTPANSGRQPSLDGRSH